MRMSALPYFMDLPEDRRRKARAVLSSEVGVPFDQLNADAVIEQVWNALVGHPLIGECENERDRSR